MATSPRYAERLGSESVDHCAEQPIVFRLAASLDEARRRFDDFLLLNPDLCVEQTADGEVQIMPPTGGESGSKNSILIARVVIWSEKHGGKVFDSSTLFILPNGAKRSPDVSWISAARWKTLNAEQRKSFPPICPDFVVELRSDSDRLARLQQKMREYRDNGARLGWLIDPLKKNVHIYRGDRETEVLASPTRLSGEKVLRGFELDSAFLW